MDGLLIIMAKQPSLGAVKTRLSPPLSQRACMALYAAFLCDTIALVDSACKLAGEVTPAVAYTPTSAGDFFRALTPEHFVLLPQQGIDLGERLSSLPSQAEEIGYSPVAMISSDSPTLPVEVVACSFAQLRQPQVDVVLGPCEDGGYYLIGMKRPQPALFEGIAWSTEHVTCQTLQTAEEAGLRVSLLPSWPDVDTVDDLAALWAHLQGNISAAPHTYNVLATIKLQLTV